MQLCLPGTNLQGLLLSGHLVTISIRSAANMEAYLTGDLRECFQSKPSKPFWRKVRRIHVVEFETKMPLSLCVVFDFGFVSEERTIFCFASIAKIDVLSDCYTDSHAAADKHGAMSAAYSCQRLKAIYSHKKHRNSQHAQIGPRTTARQRLPELPSTIAFSQHHHRLAAAARAYPIISSYLDTCSSAIRMIAAAVSRSRSRLLVREVVIRAPML